MVKVQKSKKALSKSLDDKDKRIKQLEQEKQA